MTAVAVPDGQDLFLRAPPILREGDAFEYHADSVLSKSR
jgi:hypothetical protein